MLRVCQTPNSFGGDATAQLPDHFPDFHHSAATPRRNYRIIFLTSIIRRRRHGAITGSFS
jgi:hypothetical protein